MFYRTIRSVHLYLGLFLSPFVCVFAASVFVLVHPPRGAPGGAPSERRVVTELPVSPDVEQRSGRDLADALRPALARMGLSAGEVDFVRRVPAEHRLVFPVLLPGYRAEVDLDLLRRSATIAERSHGAEPAIVHLHKMPGPHNVNMRGNSAYVRVWRVIADATSYGLLFLTLSGVYLWALLRAERKAGMALLAAGAISFLGMVYALTR